MAEVTGTSLAGVPPALGSSPGVGSPVKFVPGTADRGDSPVLGDRSCNPILPLLSADNKFPPWSTAGDITSGEPGPMPEPPWLAAASAAWTCNLGGRESVREWFVGFFFEPLESPEALRAACFCWATAMGERISLMCLSMKTGFFCASLSFWKSRSGFSS